MKINATVVWTCSLVVFLFVESCQAQKLNIHWGPQSMMYLKGKYGKRFVMEDDKQMLKQSVSALLKGIQRLQSLDLRKPRHFQTSERVFVHNL